MHTAGGGGGGGRPCLLGRGEGCIRFWARSDQNSGVHGKG